MSRLGIDFAVTTEESESISQLDSQKEVNKAIFGKACIISDERFAERIEKEKLFAQREADWALYLEKKNAEKDAVLDEGSTTWELSDRERAIIAQLSQK